MFRIGEDDTLPGVGTLQSAWGEPGEDAVGGVLPGGFEHHVVGGVGEDFDFGAVAAGGAALFARGEDGVALAREDEYGRFDALGAGKREGDHIQEGEIGFVLQAGVVALQLLWRVGGREEGFAGEARGGDDGVELPGEVGLEEAQGVFAGDVEGGTQGAAGGQGGQ